MNKIIFGFFVVVLYVAVGQALQCYNCKLGLGSFCITTKKTCADGFQCFSGLGTAAGFMDIKTKGCLKESECNQTEKVTFPPNSSTNVGLYELTKTCCSIDLCNSALGHFHFSAVTMAITSVLMVKILI